MKKLLNLEVEQDAPQDRKIIELIKNEDDFSVLNSLKSLKVSCIEPTNSEEADEDSSFLENSMILHEKEHATTTAVDEKSPSSPNESQE